MHSEEPTLEKVPLAQVWQLEEPKAVLKVPEGHEMHELWPT